MAELKLGRVKEDLKRDDQLRTNKVLSDLSLHHPDRSAAGALTLAVTEIFPVLPPRSTMTLWERIRARSAAAEAVATDKIPDPPPHTYMTRKERQVERRPIHSRDIPVFLDTITTLIHQGKLDKETADIDNLHGFLGQRMEDMQKDERRRRRLRISGGIAAVGTLGVVASTTMYNSQRAEALAEEQALVLKTTPSAPSYEVGWPWNEVGWRVSAAVPEPEMQFEPDGIPVQVGRNEGITVNRNGKEIKTRIELQSYETVDGNNGIQFFIPTENPNHEFFTVDTFRKSESDLRGERWILLASEGYVVFTAMDGTSFIIKVVDETPKDSTDTTFTVTPQRQIPKPQ